MKQEALQKMRLLLSDGSAQFKGDCDDIDNKIEDLMNGDGFIFSESQNIKISRSHDYYKELFDFVFGARFQYIDTQNHRAKIWCDYRIEPVLNK